MVKPHVSENPATLTVIRTERPSEKWERAKEKVEKLRKELTQAVVELAQAKKMLLAEMDGLSIDSEPLSRREREILVYVRAGLGNKEIASSLFIAERTVKFHVSSILKKCLAKRREQL